MNGAPGEIRTPDRSVRSSAVKMVSSYKSTTCDLDQSQNVVIKSVNEPYASIKIARWRGSETCRIEKIAFVISMTGLGNRI